MSNPVVNLNSLFGAAHDDGELSAQALQALTITADIGAQIQAGLGIAPDDVPASQVVLVTMMPDDSGSIRFAGNAQRVRDGHNLVIEALGRSKQKDDILAHTRYLNGHVLFPYRRLEDAVFMDAQNYDPNLGTPLYDEAVVMLGTVLAKTRQFEDGGVPVRSVSLILTDGEDAGSMQQTPKTVRAVLEDMLRQEKHIIAAMGIDDGHTDFRQVFREMGIQDRWILTPGNSDQEIRRAFQTFSQSAVKASQGAGHFSRAALGGFGAPRRHCEPVHRTMRAKQSGTNHRVPDCFVARRTRELLAMTSDFEIAGGTVTGREHVTIGRNNQDAFCWSATPEATVAVVADGCGSGRYSEVGAQLGARLLTEAARAWAPRLDREEPVSALERIRLDLLTQLRGLATGMGGSFSQVVGEYFLFTVQGFVITARWTTVFGIGDGVVAVNGEPRHLTAPNNAPAYLGYGLLGDPEGDAAPRFDVHAVIATPDLRSLLVGTDGVGEVPSVEELWREDRYYANPYNVGRRLVQWNRAHKPGLLPDDTTLVVARRARR